MGCSFTKADSQTLSNEKQGCTCHTKYKYTKILPLDLYTIPVSAQYNSGEFSKHADKMTNWNNNINEIAVLTSANKTKHRLSPTVFGWGYLGVFFLLMPPLYSVAFMKNKILDYQNSVSNTPTQTSDFCAYQSSHWQAHQDKALTTFHRIKLGLSGVDSVSSPLGVWQALSR